MCYLDPIEPHFRIVKLGFTGVDIFFITVDLEILSDFYFAIFSFSNYSRVLKFASKHSYSRYFRGLKIGTLCISCERQINVMHRIAAHAVRQLKLEILFVLLSPQRDNHSVCNTY